MGSRGPSNTPVRLIALGGLGEIGLNLMVLESAGRGVVIDCGVMFPEERGLGNGLFLPDISWLEESKIAIDAIVLTHAHEDHIGALHRLLDRFDGPVYGTEITLAFARRGLDEHGHVGGKSDLRPILPRKPFEAGPFTIEPIRVTHSTPDSVALAIRTPAGIVIHSGDFKIDESPIDGRMFDSERFGELGAEGVLLLLSDSTNVERAGRSGSESSIKPVIRDLMRRTQNRFFLTAFSSHLHRIRQVAEVAMESGRRVVPLGRRMAESVRLGLEAGELPFAPGTFISLEEADFLEPRKLAFLASGSQGEPLSSLTKLAYDNHPRVHVEQGDTVVLSSRFIPGNERAIQNVVNHLYRLGADVIYDAIAPVHVSGHASRDELIDMIRLVRPRYFVPIHGEYRHLSRHFSLAIEAGVPERNCILLEDSDTLTLAAGEISRGRQAHAGRILVEGGEEEDIGLIGERRILARDGAIVAIIAISSTTGAIVAGPELVSRGLVTGDGTSEHMRRARTELASRLSMIERPFRPDDARVKDEVIRLLRRYFSDAVGKRPFIIPHVMEVP